MMFGEPARYLQLAPKSRAAWDEAKLRTFEPSYRDRLSHGLAIVRY